MSYDPAKTHRLIEETDRMTTKGATFAEIEMRNQLQDAADAIVLLERELAAEKARVQILRAACEKIADIHWGWDGDCGSRAIAEHALDETDPKETP